jgi:hypothetical protein
LTPLGRRCLGFAENRLRKFQCRLHLPILPYLWVHSQGRRPREPLYCVLTLEVADGMGGARRLQAAAVHAVLVHRRRGSRLWPDGSPGTRWKDVPETWICPDCSARKSYFSMIEI